METVTEQLHSPAVCEDEQNGSVTVDDLDHIRRVNRDLEQQLSDKNRVGPLFHVHYVLFLTCTQMRVPLRTHNNHGAVADDQAAAAKTGRAEEDAAERTGETNHAEILQYNTVVFI